MDIYFLRHASAGSQKLSGKDDETRPIDEEGEEQSRDAGKLLAQLGVEPAAFVSSPLTRAVQTAQLVAKEVGFKDDITLHDALRPEGSYEQFQKLLRHYASSDSIVVTGHNPRLSEFLSLLISGGAVSGAIELKKAAVAKIDWGDSAQLSWCVTPKVVRAASAIARG